MCFFFFHDTATTEIYTYRHTLSLHDALPILEALSVDESCGRSASVSLSSLFPDSSRSSLVMLTVGAAVSYVSRAMRLPVTMIAPSAAGSSAAASGGASSCRSEEHTSELQSLMRISYAVFCLKKTKYY